MMWIQTVVLHSSQEAIQYEDERKKNPNDEISKTFFNVKFPFSQQSLNHFMETKSTATIGTTFFTPQIWHINYFSHSIFRQKHFNN